MISGVIKYINSISGDNTMIAGAISLWFMGIITYICKNVPKTVWVFVVKHTTTELTVTSQHQTFHDMLEWLQEKGYSEKFRRTKLSNGKWGFEDKSCKSVGYGTHLIFYKRRPIWITLERETNQTEQDKEMLKILKIGRSHTLFNEIWKEVKDIKKKDKNKIAVNVSKKAEWTFLNHRPRRDLDSVIIPEKDLQQILTTLDNFQKSESWYIKNGIPYHMGIMLYGPPGTGKTSLISALASHLKKSLYIASAYDVDHYPDILHRVPEEGILVIEDIDSCVASHKRPGDTKKHKEEEENTNEVLKVDEDPIASRFFSQGFSVGISELLNALDGLMTCHGRILIMTTNHIDGLDSALLRPGRVDLSIEIGYLKPETFVRFMQKFYPDEATELTQDITLNTEELTGAIMQQHVLQKRSYKELIDKYVI
jgi:chaperone BCS1